MTLNEWCAQTEIKAETKAEGGEVSVTIHINDVMRKVLWSLADYNVVIATDYSVILTPKPSKPTFKKWMPRFAPRGGM